MRQPRRRRPYCSYVPYEVQTTVYEGPFDLLLHLITREEVDLWEISLSAIVDAYLAEVERMGVVDLDGATEFLVIAATLVELKCRRLLPGPADVDVDEELALFEERDLLLARLLECKTFRDAGEALARLAGAAGLSHPRTAGLEPHLLELAPDLLGGVTPADLRAAYLRATEPKRPPKIDLDHVAPIRLSVRDVVDELAVSLPAQRRVTFRRLTAGVPTRLDVIVRFLAVLELYKQGLVDLDQPSTFGELTVTWTGPATAELAAVDVYEG